MGTIDEMLQPIPLPQMLRVRQTFQAPEVADVAGTVQSSIRNTDLLNRIAPGDTVAIAVGSRGIRDLPVLVRETVQCIQSAGGSPFIVPAMGSHGGATAAGQEEVLRQLGVSEQTVGAPIRASMDVKQIGSLPNGLPVYIDKLASEADHIVLVARIKPHTAFRGPYESGLLKMITIGLGKQKGADSAHAYGFQHMAEHIPAMATMTLAKMPILFGLGVIENAYDNIAKIVAVPAEAIFATEPDLLLEAKALMPKILFDPIDVLVVNQIGKDISGDGMDPNITGRYLTPYAHGGPKVTRIAVLNLTSRTHGNANGLGLADVTTRAVFDQIDWPLGYANALTSTVPEAVKLPMFLESAELAIKAAIKMSNVVNLAKARVVQIQDTLHLGEIHVSSSLLEDAEKHPQVEIVSNPEPMRLP